jgi:tetratricopeptide (TPR) repeat protein
VNTISSLVFLLLCAGVARAQTDCFWLEAEINGRPARLMFDTGTDGTGLFPEAVRRLGLETDVPVPDTPSEHGQVGVGKTKVAELMVEGASVRIPLYIFPLDLSSYDRQFDGLVGWPEVRNNVFLMEASTLTLKSVREVAREASRWTRFRVLTNYDMLALAIPASGTNQLVVAIDTGKPGGVTLSQQRWQEWRTSHPGRPRTLVAYRMAAVGNQVKEESWADEIALGALGLTDVPVMEANRAEVARGSTGYAGTLGMAALKRLDLVIDGKNHFAYVRPKRTPAAAYPHNRLGAVFVQEESSGMEFLAHVAPGSPAEEAGIRDGDVLLKVNGHEVAKAAGDPFLVPLILQWTPPAGTKFELLLQRGGEVRPTTVALRDILKPGKTRHAPAKTLAREVKWLMDLGDVSYRETNYDQAIHNYTEIIRLKPGAAEAFNGRGAAYYFKGSNDLALADFDEAIRLKPDCGEAFNNRGSLWANAWHDQAKAIADYTAAIRCKRNEADTFHNRGVSHGLNGDARRAVADFDQAIERNPDFARAFLDRGIGYQALGDYPRAFLDFSEAIRLQPELAEACRDRGGLQLLTNNFEAGIRDLSVAIHLNPADAAALHNRGTAYRLRGAFDQAIADLTEALRLNPADATALINRGSAYEQKRDYAQAIADYERALQLEPGNPASSGTLARALAACPDEALRDGKQALQYALNACERTAWQDAAALDILAMAYAANGNFAEAVKWEQTALRATLPDDVRAAALDRLKLYQQNKPYLESGR